jgi:hypothetical protein
MRDIIGIGGQVIMSVLRITGRLSPSSLFRLRSLRVPSSRRFQPSA